jgi:GRAM domain
VSSYTFAQLVIPIEEITHVDKRMTAYVIPNALQISAQSGKYTFASLLSRDTTYDVIFNIWRSVRPEVSIPNSPRASLDGVAHTASVGSVVEGILPAVSEKLGSALDSALSSIASIPHKSTVCACGKEGKHYTESALETILPGEPEKIYNLMFASAFMKEFMRNEEKLMGAWYRRIKNTCLTFVWHRYTGFGLGTHLGGLQDADTEHVVHQAPRRGTGSQTDQV